MEAFHNDPLIKEYYFNRLNEHYKADEIIQGKYWENGKGCAVGCTIHSSDHDKYESKLGIPICLAYLQDTIFEGLPNELAKVFPIEFLSVIKVGSNLSKVSKLFMIWVLTDEKYGVLQYAEDKKVIQDVADAIEQDMVSLISVEEWLELMDNALYYKKIAFNSAKKWLELMDNSLYTADEVASAAYTTDISSFYVVAISHSHAAAAAYSVAASYSAFSSASHAAVHAANACISKNTKSEYYIAASKKLIELLKNAN